MFYIFLFLFVCLYYYKIIICNVVVKRHEQLVDVIAIKINVINNCKGLFYMILKWLSFQKEFRSRVKFALLSHGSFRAR